MYRNGIFYVGGKNGVKSEKLKEEETNINRDGKE